MLTPILPPRSQSSQSGTRSRRTQHYISPSASTRPVLIKVGQLIPCPTASRFPHSLPTWLTNKTVNWLSSRTFGTWTFMASVLRLYAAYNITNPVVYDLAIWSYVIAGWHFLSEWLIFGTASYVWPVPSPLVNCYLGD